MNAIEALEQAAEMAILCLYPFRHVQCASVFAFAAYSAYKLYLNSKKEELDRKYEEKMKRLSLEKHQVLCGLYFVKLTPWERYYAQDFLVAPFSF